MISCSYQDDNGLQASNQGVEKMTTIPMKKGQYELDCIGRGEWCVYDAASLLPSGRYQTAWLFRTRKAANEYLNKIA